MGFHSRSHKSIRGEPEFLFFLTRAKNREWSREKPSKDIVP